MGCQYEEVPMDTETGDLTVNYSDLPIPERESTRLSIASSLLHEETSHDISVDNAFDVTRPDRSMVVEEAEMSLQDETVTDVPSSAGVTFEVIDKGTERGKPKLVSSDGYSYVVNRKFPSGTVDWRCSIRRKGMSCYATIKQKGDIFQTSTRGHSHTAKPGLKVSVKLNKQVIY